MKSTSSEHITTFYKCHEQDGKHHLLKQKLDQLTRLDARIVDLREEHCFYVASSEPLTAEERKQILWLIEPKTGGHNGSYDDCYLTISDKESHLRSVSSSGANKRVLVEVGPRLNFCSPFSTNAVSILRSSCAQTTVHRLERSTIYELTLNVSFDDANDECETKQLLGKLSTVLYDEMVETIYERPVETFHPEAARSPIAQGEPWLQPCADVDILKRGDVALREISNKLGLYFDEWDINYYVSLFRDTIKRNPTVIECFDLAQSNSEHSRHWFFRGILDIEGRIPHSKSLIDMVVSTQKFSNPNNVIKFEDNSSAIEGFDGLTLLRPKEVDRWAPFEVAQSQMRHIILTAETHNFPTGVAPFPGAATGTGGRIRDVQATGRGAHVIAGTAGYSFGNLLLDGYDELDWENPHELYPKNLAPPHRIAIEASNGASDYGNKFGEPIVAGFARSFGMRLVSPLANTTERWEYLKPIMFTGGIGSIDAEYTKKLRPEEGMKVTKVGGPVYRIGIGGGAASSATDMTIKAPTASDGPTTSDASGGDDDGGGASGGDENKKFDSSEHVKNLNFNAVQRGDPEMEQKLNRIIRACIENRSATIDDKNTEYNPIYSIHDQGAGGNCNVLKEIVDPLGATIDANKFTLGDHTVNILELWAAEYQESDALLAINSKRSQQFLERLAEREKCKVDFVGEVNTSGRIRLLNFSDYDKQTEKEYPIDLKLEHVIGSMPKKVFNLEDYNLEMYLTPAKLIEAEEPPKNLKLRYKMMQQRMYHTSQNQMMDNFEHLLKKVLKLPSVASKRYLTTKVDRCVTGLIAGQQCLGPLHTPIGDYALVALSHFNLQGTVTSIGEQPIKGLVSPVSNATMSVAEALTNMMFCVISSLKDVKCSANWMWAAKLPGEGAKLLDACEAMCKLMNKLGIAVDGGKDSLSMSAVVDPADARRLVQLPTYEEKEAEQSADDAVETVKSPGTLVISAYAPVPDIRRKVTPILKCKPKRGHLIYVNLAHPILTDYHCGHVNRFRLGGSALLQTLGQIGEEAPTIDHPELLRDGFEIVQELIKEGRCTAGHDVSDGGLIVCALEMAIASHCGLHLNIQGEKSFGCGLGGNNLQERVFGAMFAEECAVIIEVEAESEKELNDVLERFENKQIYAQRIGFGTYDNQRITIKFEQQLLLDYENNHKIREYWEMTSKQLDLRQANNSCVIDEYDNMSLRPHKPDWKLTFDPNLTKVVVDFDKHYLSEQPKVAVLREEGINGDREMVASLVMAGFQVFDVTVTDLTMQNVANKRANLNVFDGLVFPGGFSYADVFGSARGWAASLMFNKEIQEQLVEFRRRPGTFSLGVCNGCQLMALLGFLEDLPSTSKDDTGLPEPTVRLEQNNSGRFECRFVNVRIERTTNSIMLHDMEESTFGVWVAHGEGKFKIQQSVEVIDEPETRIALRYVDDKGEPTMEYPMNPNGSDQAVAGMCSRDGRHLAMMPHPERCTQLWQWPYLLPEWHQEETNGLKTSPWMQMFVNAYEFCKRDELDRV
jgi:phosphoribosylformylglycinamidine synthase